MANNQNENDIACALSDISTVSNRDDYDGITANEVINGKYSDCEDIDLPKSNASASCSYNNNDIHDSRENELRNYDTASSGYQLNRISGPSRNNGYSEPPESTNIPPELEENVNSTTGTRSNERKYFKIKINAIRNEVPQKISTFQSSSLCEIILNNLKNCNYTKPSTIQKYTLPAIMNGKDVMVSALTGSGKTTAYILAILNKLHIEPSELVVDYNHCEPQVLIMSPTRELAIQIRELVTRLSRDTGIKCELLCGGTASYYQRENILRGVHILIATPGRLTDFVNQGLITFSSLRYCVLDEADRLLDLGFQLDIHQVLCDSNMVLAAERTILIFSATLSNKVQILANACLKSDYLSISLGFASGACQFITQTVLEVKQFDKKNELMSILNETDDCQGTLVFVEKKRFADFIAIFLSDMDYPTTSIHGDRRQQERETALKDFKQKKMKVLVATSVVSRELDTIGVTKIINFDIPKKIKIYKQRMDVLKRSCVTAQFITFFDSERDRIIAPHLINILTMTNQMIPPFLLQFIPR